MIDVPRSGSWLKVPLGKLDTERMVPIDEDILALIDRITATRSPGRPIPHPRTGRPADFLFTAHGRRLGQSGVRRELNRATTAAGLGHITTHQLRHTYATALVVRRVAFDATWGSIRRIAKPLWLLGFGFRVGPLDDVVVIDTPSDLR